MERPLRLARGDDTSARFRDSYPFPVAAASALTPVAKPQPARTLPFPFSHPENDVPTTPKPSRVDQLGSANRRPRRAAPRSGALDGPSSDLFGVMPTHELIRQIDHHLDRIKSKTDDLRDQIDNYQFPQASDDERPYAA